MSTVDGTSRPEPPWTVSSRRSLVPSSDSYRDGSFIPTSSRALCGAALALVTVSLTSALWRRATKAVTALGPSKFTSDERPPGNSDVPVQGPAAMFEQNAISPAGLPPHILAD